MYCTVHLRLTAADIKMSRHWWVTENITVACAACFSVLFRMPDSVGELLFHSWTGGGISKHFCNFPKQAIWQSTLTLHVNRAGVFRWSNRRSFSWSTNSILLNVLAPVKDRWYCCSTASVKPSEFLIWSTSCSCFTVIKSVWGVLRIGCFL